MATDFAQPPRFTGDPATDFPSMVDYLWSFYRSVILQTLANGKSVTIATAKLTGGGSNGSMTFVNGILVDFTQAT